VRNLAPASLRYLELEPGPGLDVPWVFGLQVGALGSLLAAAEWGMHAAIAAGPSVAVAFLIASVTKQKRKWGAMPPIPTAMLITPWGIVLDPTGDPEPVRWMDLQEIDHERIEGTRRDAWSGERPATSVLRVIHHQTRHVGKRSYELDLETLEGILPALRAQQERPVVLGLEAASPSLELGKPGAFSALLTEARVYLESEEAEAGLCEHRGGYRARETVLRPEGKVLLTQLLEEAPSFVDRAPFAAVIAAEMGFVEVVRTIAAQALAPHPFVAAVLKAAAHKLGAGPSLPGPIDEVRPFLPDDELAAMQAWATVSGPRSGPDAT
jgi:hypothetical protein